MLQLQTHTCDLLLICWNTILEIMNNFKQYSEKDNKQSKKEDAI